MVYNDTMQGNRELASSREHRDEEGQPGSIAFAFDCMQVAVAALPQGLAPSVSRGKL
jgi:hypothetical protein